MRKFDLIYYEGEYEDEKWNGYGIKRNPDGSSYEGYFKDNKPNGKGV